MKNKEQFIASTIENGGATMNPVTGDVPTSGYVVSMAGNEQTYKLFGNEVVKEILVSGAVDLYVKENVVELSHPENYLGSWIDDGMLYLDISRVYESEHDALREAVNNGQKAYYDLNNAKTIEL
jgi:hypothetical protein